HTQNHFSKMLQIPPPPIALNHYFNSGFLYFNLPKFANNSNKNSLPPIS
ncbi:MAG: hypothetical protein K2N75_06715, partial [Helicobacter sp.]|nr:hypothetical protein [Helicobacter sp.]